MAPEPRRPPPLLPTALVAVLLGLLVLIAPSVGPWDFTAREFDFGSLELPEDENEEEEAGPEEFDYEEIFGDAPATDGTPSPIWTILAITVLVAAGVAVVLFLILLWLRHRRAAPPELDEGEREVDAVVSAEEQIPMMRAGTHRARTALSDRETAVGEGIIAAWLALETAATESGMQRRPADTPTELTVRVLQRTAADPQATDDLLRLYHRARFSTAPLGPAERARAADALDRLAASWDQVQV